MKRDEGIVELKRLSDWEIEIVDPNNNLHVKIGSSMGSFNKMWEGLIVDYVNENNIIKLHEGKMFKAVVNDKDELRWYGDKSDGYKVYDSVEQFLKERKQMTNNKQQTAVEWLYETLWKQTDFSLPSNILEQAKEMEKERMIKFARFVLYEAKPTWDGFTTELTIDEYYNETYGDNK